MEWISNEMIFYGGIIISSVALLLAIVFAFVFTIKKINLKARLDSEYGKQIAKVRNPD